ncbi:nucleotidyltransferase [Peribacillus huizhouensis]|uniref:tRNA(Met) cytidine acetate ligase n=1 Tax=Peribacillus huizhouensis TaxID=1501239 RepID=A0ABR6CIY6_9BACI|nr:nucleotidyltransferase [Peribacillus huizhouensis]MBA9024980.1 putative nucleotidyltransferase [Peribacillus huizhouensis]
MKAVGLVVEYNPFHNGHVYHAIESKKAAKADVVIAVMSGSFLQRGEPALVNKWARAKMALKGGIDLVFELPYPFATQQAGIFAQGAISILETLACDTFCFGSENGRLEPFMSTYQFLLKNKDEFDEKIRYHLKAGYSYPKATSLAFNEIQGHENVLDLTQPNNILGLEYVKTALSKQFKIKPMTIHRIAAGYHDTELSTGSIASATGIRKAIADKKNLKDIFTYIPESTKDVLEQYLAVYHSFHDWEKYWPLLKYQILSATVEELASIYEIEEGIEFRMKEMAAIASSFHEFITLLKTKRYTWTRIQRMCVHLLTRMKKEDMHAFIEAPAFLRLLGMNSNGREYLNKIKKDLPIPLISRLSAFNDPSIQPDLRASQVYALGLSQPYQKLLMQREYKSPVIVNE